MQLISSLHLFTCKLCKQYHHSSMKYQLMIRTMSISHWHHDWNWNCITIYDWLYHLCTMTWHCRGCVVQLAEKASSVFTICGIPSSTTYAILCATQWMIRTDKPIATPLACFSRIILKNRLLASIKWHKMRTFLTETFMGDCLI